MSGARKADSVQLIPLTKMAVNLVHLMIETAKGNYWILVLVVYFTRWQNALVIPDATAAEVAFDLDKK